MMEDTDYRSYIRAELKARKIRNPSYSLRAFARDLGMSPSFLSEILSGKHRLSRASAERVILALKISDEDAHQIMEQVAREQSASSGRQLWMDIPSYTETGGHEADEKIIYPGQFTIEKADLERLISILNGAPLKVSTPEQNHQSQCIQIKISICPFNRQQAREVSAGSRFISLKGDFPNQAADHANHYGDQEHQGK